MSITSKGYGTQEIGEAEWAQMAAHIGAPYAYAGPNALRPAPAPGLDRGIQIGDGTTFGWGIKDDLSGERAQLPAVTSGSASYMVVLRRQWGANGRTSTLVTLPMAGSSPSGRRTSPGNVDDQPICLGTVTAGSVVVTGVVDLRVFGAKSYFAPSLQAASLDPALGARYVLPNGDRYVGMLSAAGTVQLAMEKQPDQVVIPPIPNIVTGTSSVDFSDTGTASIAHNIGRVPKFIAIESRSIASSIQITVDVAYGATAVTATAFAVIAKKSKPTAPYWEPYTGNLSAIDWMAVV